MLQNIKRLYGDKLGASDGEIGHVEDFYFDDQNWVVRYVVVDTGTWLSERQVLLTPHAFEGFHQSGKLVFVNLTRQQIEGSPAIESHKPVSRQFEEEYYQYYGWPNYWVGTGMWGESAFPLMQRLEKPPTGQPAHGTHSTHADAHLRSTRAIDGYQIHAKDGMIGYVSDYVMDSQNWWISHLVVTTHSEIMKEVQISTSKTARISYEESTVHVNMSKKEIENCTEAVPESTEAIH